MIIWGWYSFKHLRNAVIPSTKILAEGLPKLLIPSARSFHLSDRKQGDFFVLPNHFHFNFHEDSLLGIEIAS